MLYCFFYWFRSEESGFYLIKHFPPQSPFNMQRQLGSISSYYDFILLWNTTLK